jgi:hypothetical protein
VRLRASGGLRPACVPRWRPLARRADIVCAPLVSGAGSVARADLLFAAARGRVSVLRIDRSWRRESRASGSPHRSFAAAREQGLGFSASIVRGGEGRVSGPSLPSGRPCRVVVGVREVLPGELRGGAYGQGRSVIHVGSCLTARAPRSSGRRARGRHAQHERDGMRARDGLRDGDERGADGVRPAGAGPPAWDAGGAEAAARAQAHSRWTGTTCPGGQVENRSQSAEHVRWRGTRRQRGTQSGGPVPAGTRQPRPAFFARATPASEGSSARPKKARGQTSAARDQEATRVAARRRARLRRT